MEEGKESSPREADRLVYAGLLGLSVAGVFHLFECSELDVPRMIAVYSFALAVPLLAAGLITDYARRAGHTIPAWHHLVVAFGGLLAVIGFGSMFFHFGVFVGSVFTVGVACCLVLVRRL